VRIRDLRLAVKADPQTFQVPHASGRLNASSFNVRLSLPRTPGPSPVARFQVSAPVMDVEDLALLVSLRSTDRTGGGRLSAWTLQGGLEVGTGRFSGQTASRLRTDLEYRGGRLTVSNASLQALGGSFTGDGTVDLTDEKRPRYEVTFAMSDVPAASFLRLTPLPPDKLSGPVSAKGRLEATGADEGSLRRTLSGDVQIRVGQGVIKEFAVLSKIFSILNISQLLRARLPDMTVDGMPFRSIRASWRLADGIARTDDLLLRGPAMNIAAQGQLDLRRETMDMTVGVQPLKTIDKVVSRIPVLGWILTDTDRRFLTVTFEAKGPWRDPVVKAIPVRALALEVLNIFKRVLELPAKLLTDAGEVF
jgi:uncharacterized protein YhdP